MPTLHRAVLGLFLCLLLLVVWTPLAVAQQCDQCKSSPEYDEGDPTTITGYNHRFEGGQSQKACEGEGSDDEDCHEVRWDDACGVAHNECLPAPEALLVLAVAAAESEPTQLLDALRSMPPGSYAVIHRSERKGLALRACDGISLIAVLPLSEELLVAAEALEAAR